MARKSKQREEKKAVEPEKPVVEEVADASEEASPDSEDDAPPEAPAKKTTKEEQKGSEAEDEASPESDEEVKEKPKKKAKKQDKEKSGDDSEGDDKKKKKKIKRRDQDHPPTTDMVLEALLALDEKKGTSIRALKDFIMAENTVRAERISFMLRKALKKLVEKESIIRPKGEENKSVMMGRYKIAPKKEEKAEKPRERPSSLRKLTDPNATATKKKKKRRKF